MDYAAHRSLLDARLREVERLLVSVSSMDAPERGTFGVGQVRTLRDRRVHPPSAPSTASHRGPESESAAIDAHRSAVVHTPRPPIAAKRFQAPPAPTTANASGAAIADVGQSDVPAQRTRQRTRLATAAPTVCRECPRDTHPPLQREAHPPRQFLVPLRVPWLDAAQQGMATEKRTLLRRRGGSPDPELPPNCLVPPPAAPVTAPASSGGSQPAPRAAAWVLDLDSATEGADTSVRLTRRTPPVLSSALRSHFVDATGQRMLPGFLAAGEPRTFPAGDPSAEAAASPDPVAACPVVPCPESIPVPIQDAPTPTHDTATPIQDALVRFEDAPTLVQDPSPCASAVNDRQPGWAQEAGQMEGVRAEHLHVEAAENPGGASFPSASFRGDTTGPGCQEMTGPECSESPPAEGGFECSDCNAEMSSDAATSNFHQPDGSHSSSTAIPPRELPAPAPVIRLLRRDQEAGAYTSTCFHSTGLQTVGGDVRGHVICTRANYGVYKDHTESVLEPLRRCVGPRIDTEASTWGTGNVSPVVFPGLRRDSDLIPAHVTAPPVFAAAPPSVPDRVACTRASTSREDRTHADDNAGSLRPCVDQSLAQNVVAWKFCLRDYETRQLPSFSQASTPRQVFRGRSMPPDRTMPKPRTASESGMQGRPWAWIARNGRLPCVASTTHQSEEEAFGALAGATGNPIGTEQHVSLPADSVKAASTKASTRWFSTPSGHESGASIPESSVAHAHRSGTASTAPPTYADAVLRKGQRLPRYIAAVQSEIAAQVKAERLAHRDELRRNRQNIKATGSTIPSPIIVASHNPARNRPHGSPDAPSVDATPDTRDTECGATCE
jgi:hypothetical protein